MSDFSLLNDEEYSRICAAIPHGIVVGYFKKNPKEFSKIRPGFRATAVKSDDAVKLMVKCLQNRFVSSFVERIANDWIAEISIAITDYQKEGEAEISACIHALSQSYFADNTSAYFKLNDKDYSDKEITLIRDTIKLLKNYDEKLNDIEEKLKRTLQELEECKRANKSSTVKSKRKIEESAAQIRRLNEKIKELQRIELLFKDAQRDLEKCQNDKESLMSLNASQGKKLAVLQCEIDNITKEKDKLEISIRKKVEEEHKEIKPSEVFSAPLRPTDMDEFIDYLQYNFESIGVKNVPEVPIKDLLSYYISNILFYGKPIVCDKAISEALVGCIANALIGTPNVSSIHFSSEITERSLREFLINSSRIVVIDNFLGNFNDAVLLTIIGDYKNKIVFLTYSYSKTLKYVSNELFAYCNYIGVTQMPELSIGVLPNEDPSIIDEEEYEPDLKYYDNRFEKNLRNILIELGYNNKVINAKTLGVSDERRLCEILAFDIIPYCFDVRSINPLNYSQTLQKYIHKSCYAKLLERWLNA